MRIDRYKIGDCIQKSWDIVKPVKEDNRERLNKMGPAPDCGI